ncbi:MAG TPA: ABC transporter permease [Symbiobacteriaceae bacterium]|nr:ABC transporter permease [Symbiobacteriaceae bacterium]
MGRYLTKRIINMIPLLILATMISFAIIQAAPGGPENMFLSGEDATLDPTRLEALREQWGLNDPIPVQYGRWLGNVFRGDFGYSYFQRRPVATIIGEALPNTLRLSIFVIALSYSIAIPIGIISAVRQYSIFDYTVTSLAFLGQAAPNYWIALLVIYYVAMKSGGIIPTNGIATPGINFETYGWISVLLDRARYMVLPLTVMVFGSLTGLTRYMRSSMLEVLKEDYTRTARAKGLSEKVVIYRHALRNALLPIVTISSGLLSSLVGGSVIIETIFSWPGIGRVGFDAVGARDYMVTMAIMLMGGILSLVGLLLVDIVYVIVDPRIKYD